MRQLSWMLLTLSASAVRAKAWSTGMNSSSPLTTGDASAAGPPATLTVASHTVGG